MPKDEKTHSRVKKEERKMKTKYSSVKKKERKSLAMYKKTDGQRRTRREARKNETN